jgi:DNA-binding transcriptional MerR regulator
MSKELLIYELSEQLDITPKSIRYYEKVDILNPERNSYNNCRVYSEKDIKKLEFVKRVREMNFSVDKIKQIIQIKQEGYFPCNKVLSLLSNL